MILFVNQNNEIKDVNVTADPTLIPLEVNDDEMNPFANWSVAKICCYKVSVSEGVVTMMTPYVDSRLIEHIDQLGKQGDSLETRADGTDESITGLEDMILEMSEIIYA